MGSYDGTILGHYDKLQKPEFVHEILESFTLDAVSDCVLLFRNGSLVFVNKV